MSDNTKEPSILPVRPGTLTAKDKAALRKVGIIVIEHEKPEEIRLLRPSVEISGSELLLCAINALNAKHTTLASGQREEFTRQVFLAMTKAVT